MATRRVSTITLFLNFVESMLGASAGACTPQGNVVALLSKRPICQNHPFCTMLRSYGVAFQTNHCSTLEEYRQLAKCRYAVALDNFGLEFAQRLQLRYGIPFVPLLHRFDLVEINKEFEALGQLLQKDLRETIWKNYKSLEAAVSNTIKRVGRQKIAVSSQEQVFPLAAAVSSFGLDVRAVFCDTISESDKPYLAVLQKNQSPIFISSRVTAQQMTEFSHINIAIGSKAGFFCEDAKMIPCDDRYQFGYDALRQILEAMA